MAHIPALANYITATRAAGLAQDGIAGIILVIQTPSRFFVITRDPDGECVLGVFEDGGHRPVPLKEGTLEQCLSTLTFENTME